jgi:hypothetical protein
MQWLLLTSLPFLLPSKCKYRDRAQVAARHDDDAPQFRESADDEDSKEGPNATTATSRPRKLHLPGHNKENTDKNEAAMIYGAESSPHLVLHIRVTELCSVVSRVDANGFYFTRYSDAFSNALCGHAKTRREFRVPCLPSLQLRMPCAARLRRPSRTRATCLGPPLLVGTLRTG